MIVKLVLALSLLAPLVTDLPPDAVVVTLHDLSGAAVVGATVSVRDTANTVLGDAITDASGTAVVAPVRAATVRVVVGGIWQGYTLRQTGADAVGVQVVNDATPLALRVEPTGAVVIDPIMFVVEDAGTPLPTAVRDAALATTAAPLPTPFVAPLAPLASAAPAVPPAAVPTPLWAWGLLVALCVGVVAALLLGRRLA